jgi:hypothetical protein
MGVQVRPREDGDGLATELGLDALGPCVVELDTIDLRDEVDSDGFDAHLEDEARVGTVIDRQVMERRPEPSQRPKDPQQPPAGPAAGLWRRPPPNPKPSPGSH